MGAEICYILIIALSLMAFVFATFTDHPRHAKAPQQVQPIRWPFFAYGLDLVALLVIASSYAMWWIREPYLIETAAHYYFPMWKLMLGTLCMHGMLYILWRIDAALGYILGVRGMWFSYACLVLVMIYGSWWVKDISDTYDADDTNVPAEAAQFSFEAVQKAFADLGYRLPVHFPIGMTADPSESISPAIKSLYEAGVLERIHRPSLVHEKNIILYQPNSAYWHDYDPLHGLRFADVSLTRLNRWKYAYPLSRKKNEFLRTLDIYANSVENVSLYTRRADEPRRYTAEWQTLNYRPWTNDEQVMSSFPEIQKVKAAEVVSEKKSIITKLDDMIYVNQLDPLAPMHVLRKETAPDRAIYLDQQVNPFLHEQRIINAINTYLATYTGLVAVDKKSKNDKLIIQNGNVTLPPGIISQKLNKSLEAMHATRNKQKTAIIVDPDLPAIVETEETAYIRYAFFTLDEIKSVSRVYETENTNHFGYCQVRFTCKAAWVAPWIYDKSIISSHPLLAERVNTLSDHEIVWTIKINELGWHTGVREYGGEYSVVHNLPSGSGV